MKLELDIEPTSLENREPRIEFKIEHGITTFSGFDYINIDAVESLELNLTKIVQKLYDYRKQQGEQQND